MKSPKTAVPVEHMQVIFDTAGHSGTGILELVQHPEVTILSV